MVAVYQRGDVRLYWSNFHQWGVDRRMTDWHPRLWDDAALCFLNGSILSWKNLRWWLPKSIEIERTNSHYCFGQTSHLHCSCSQWQAAHWSSEIEEIGTWIDFVYPTHTLEAWCVCPALLDASSAVDGVCVHETVGTNGTFDCVMSCWNVKLLLQRGQAFVERLWWNICSSWFVSMPS